MPSDATPLDLIAFVWFLGAWTAFTLVQDYLLTGRVAVNQHLTLIRSAWMERMLERDNRIMDSQLVGHTMNSCTFFASTTMLVLAGLVGSFGAIERVHEIMGGLSFTVRTSRELLEIKVLVLMGIFVFGFFKFTWALRQYNYCCALIGSAPLPPVPEAERKAMAGNIAAAMTLAVKAFNGGLRAYYFALAALAWFIHPGVLIAATAFVLAVLIRRQAFSRTERVISAQADALERGVTKQ
ncbi:DUF599 family protein [Azospirillum sp. TSO22-1]|uniref:DUF599 domain-containing protein n=1 Tax=Azospirillum sp. TSO22-1 TaxID=716789 RepID=UPI000D61208F|nr:DUF599 family protein [Azospirillum sp. TSO22-1]PWC45708.1 hypothetical protein TSO221_16195 [Azospirillum sp. TSO22-1]